MTYEDAIEYIVWDYINNSKVKKNRRNPRTKIHGNIIIFFDNPTKN